MSGTFTYDSHYGITMYPSKLKIVAKKAARNIQRKFRSKEFKKFFPVLVYRGMSGVATATAISQNFTEKFDGKFGMMYVRKQHEVDDSHGDRIEVNNVHEIDYSIVKFIFCDDFISSGKTIIETMNTIQREFQIRINMTDMFVALTDYYSCDIVEWNKFSSCVEKYRINDAVETFYKEMIEEIQTEEKKRNARANAIIDFLNSKNGCERLSFDTGTINSVDTTFKVKMN